MHDPNPYAPANIETNASPHLPSEALPIAGQTRRFVNMLIDNLLLYGINYVIGNVVASLAVFAGLGVSFESLIALQWFLFMLSLFVMAVYYTVCEATTGRTLGKLITGTLVVSADGGNPTLNQVLGRSLCRFIPFEPLSFFGGKSSHYPVGWHDRIPGTRVVVAESFWRTRDR